MKYWLGRHLSSCYYGPRARKVTLIYWKVPNHVFLLRWSLYGHMGDTFKNVPTSWRSWNNNTNIACDLPQIRMVDNYSRQKSQTQQPKSTHIHHSSSILLRRRPVTDCQNAVWPSLQYWHTKIVNFFLKTWNGVSIQSETWKTWNCALEFNRR